MSARHVVLNDEKGPDWFSGTQVTLIFGAMVIASVPLILGMIFWLPGWLEQSGLTVARAAVF